MSEAEIVSDNEAPLESLASGVGPSDASHQQGKAANNATRKPPCSATAKTANINRIQGRTTVGSTKTILPAEKVFPVQVGTELFRLSGASIASDGPSYFTQFFEDQVRQNEESGGVRTLYIDRDPVTFRDIARHLQGYHVKPTDGPHFVRLFADAQFYSLPRLIQQLFESEIFIQIGEQHFQIPKDLFSDPGNSPNFFSLGFAVFFSTRNDVFPGLDKRGLLRPPPINPPYVPSRSSHTFAELLHLLRGYPLHIRNEEHRTELLRDCRYFHLRGLEQKIIACEITYNLFRGRDEICLRLEDIKPSGISYRQEEDRSDSETNAGGWVHYSRPFVDESSYEMVVEIGGESSAIDLNDMRADFHGGSKKRVASLLQIIANKMNLPNNAPVGLLMLSGSTPSTGSSPDFSSLSDDRVKVRLEPATDITLDGESYAVDWSAEGFALHGGPSQTAITLEPEPEHSDTSMHRVVDSIQPKQAKQSNKGNKKNATVGARMGAIASADAQPPSKRRRIERESSLSGKWTIKTGQWRLRIQPSQESLRSGYELVFIAVKLDAFTGEKARNARRNFLG